MVTALLRFPDLACPVTMTGDPWIDTYLMDLDRELIGGASVRRLTLLEIKDHLLARKAAARKTGVTEVESAKLAVAEIGPPESYAAPQRQRLKRLFLHLLALEIPMCLAAFWGLFFLFDPPRAGTGTLLFQGGFAVLFGCIGAWCGTLHFAPRTLPYSDVAGCHFVVAPRPEHRVILDGLLVFLLVGWPLMCILASLANQSFAVLPLVGLSLAALPAIAWRRSYAIDPDGFRIRSLGREEQVPWARVRGVRQRRRIRSLPDWIAWRQGVVLQYESRSGRLRTRLIPPGMLNLDQFHLLLQQKLGGR